jgi:glycerophosphoryl diester phosphodiesterase
MPSVEIIAHRGASRERPENTIPAFSRAAELGADGIELDVHLTADGNLVVHHDAVLREQPDRAIAGREIRSLTVDELSAFRVKGEPIPTLGEVIGAVRGRLRVYCELKGVDTAQEAVRQLATLGAEAAVHAFDHRQVAVARRLAPQLARGVLESSYHLAPTFPMESVDARDLWQEAGLIDRDLVDAVHARGGRVVAWTVDDATEMRRLASLGVNALCTNDVALCRRVLGR